jgi:putative transcriptional regulator
MIPRRFFSAPLAMREGSQYSEIVTSIAPGFLVAMPALRDPNFSGAVVLMLEHNESGAVGLVVNRPFPGSDAEILNGLGIDLLPDTQGEVRAGGPVRVRAGCIIHPPQWAFEDTQYITTTLCVSTSREALSTLANTKECPFRLMLGYAGWGAAQLESEIREGTWLHVPLKEELLFEVAPEQMYDTVLASVGISSLDLVSGSLAVH